MEAMVIALNMGSVKGFKQLELKNVAKNHLEIEETMAEEVALPCPFPPLNVPPPLELSWLSSGGSSLSP